ncbi:hypothetical protein [Candidatus Nanohalobium constans]|nr:hypothetical protein [Candidatus Nanohalobium constans]
MTESENQDLSDFSSSYPEIGEVKEQLMKEREEFKMRDYKIDAE